MITVFVHSILHLFTFFFHLPTAKKVFPMQNGKLDQSGALSYAIKGVGTLDKFCSMANRKGIDVIDAEPGVDVDVF